MGAVLSILATTLVMIRVSLSIIGGGNFRLFRNIDSI